LVGRPQFAVADRRVRLQDAQPHQFGAAPARDVDRLPVRRLEHVVDDLAVGILYR
jgi:hypothetical protein